MSIEEERRTHFWQALAAISFGLWSLMVPISAKWVVSSLSDMAEAQKFATMETARRNEMMEGRMVRIEERQQFVLEELRRMKAEHEVLGHGPISRPR
ncbi:MAG: hypothetical protein V2I51_16025 [Anderseniella sp.]|nr:hypothetical protein [Anderseniella sp.]